MEQDLGPIAFSLPLRPSPYESDTLFPFFDNLIPEGWLLSHLEGTFKIDKRNRFALLLASGRETVGAVKVVALKDDDTEVTPTMGEALPPPKDCQGIKLLGSLGTGASVGRIKGISLDARDYLHSFRQTIYGSSISGAQRKGLFRLEKGELIPAFRESRYIVKPPGTYDYLPENEFLTTAMAHRAGFSVPEFALVDIGGIGRATVAKRFDVHQDGTRARMEDFAQILGVEAEGKYSQSYEKVAKALRRHSSAPLADLDEMLRRLLFSFLVGNGDMHLKNWSLLEVAPPGGIFRLSPCYDFLNTRLPIPGESTDLSLTLGGKRKGITLKLFRQFAKAFDVGHLFDDALKKIDGWGDIAKEFIPKSFLPKEQQSRYLFIVEARYRILRSRH